MSCNICIDPGHGGKDPGAVGPTGLEEASVALDIAHQVNELLIDYDVEVRMTRTTDVFIELDDRCEIANDWQADYFVSVHLNSNGSSAAGIETLYKSDKGKALAGPVQKAMLAATGDKDRGLKYRDDLYVLNGTNMPAILVEVGFISHPEFEAKFKGQDYRQVLANAIVQGLAGYLGLSVPAPISPEPKPEPEPEMPTVTITIDAPSNVKVSVVSAPSSTGKVTKIPMDKRVSKK